MGPVFHGAAVGFSEMAYRDGRKSPVLSILPSDNRHLVIGLTMSISAAFYRKPAL
jgi:hypothetical protein